MEVFQEYLSKLENESHQRKLEEILKWITVKYPNLTPKIGWNQPMFTDHGTYIIGFSVSKQHLAVAPEKVAIDYFSEEINKSGYDSTKLLFRIKWDDEVDYSLLGRIIDYNIHDKLSCDTFWRK